MHSWCSHMLMNAFIAKTFWFWCYVKCSIKTVHNCCGMNNQCTTCTSSCYNVCLYRCYVESPLCRVHSALMRWRVLYGSNLGHTTGDPFIDYACTSRKQWNLDQPISCTMIVLNASYICASIVPRLLGTRVLCNCNALSQVKQTYMYVYIYILLIVV